MITCDFENRGAAGLCEYLTRCIEQQIENGVLKGDEKLPSKRELAMHLGISVITVQNAYADLISRGYVYSLEKKGFFVTPVARGGAVTSLSPHRTGVSHENPTFMPPSVAADGIDLRTNTTSYEKFPFSVWSRVTRQILQEPHEDLLRRQPLEGTWALRTAIARYLQSFRNMQVSPEQIIIAAGSEVLYSFLVQLFPAGTVFGVENPGYPNTRRILQSCGGAVVPLPLDDEGLIVDGLDGKLCSGTYPVAAAAAQVVHVTPNHHFPTGVVMSVQRRLQLLNWAMEPAGQDQPAQQRYIIEDDYDSEFRFRGKPLSPLYAMAAAYGSPSENGGPQVIYLNTFSKTLAPGFRISYMVLPPALLAQFKERLGFYSCTVSALEQHTLARFMDQGHYARHIMRMKNWYRSLRDQLITAIESSALRDRCTIQEEDAGLHFLLTVTSGNGRYTSDQTVTAPAAALQQRLKEAGLHLSLLSEYYAGQDLTSSGGSANAGQVESPAARTDSNSKTVTSPADIPAVFIINYSGLTPATIRRTVEILSRVL
ncbi:MAG: PLP-dependent aminotransferase family protein [Treponemataceae bacterium]|nr:PLP-dependent aminotransferase family protein [Treponemataceae bacterium]